MKNKLFVVSLVMFLTFSMTALAQPDFRGMGMGKRLAGRNFFARQDFLPARFLLRAKEELGLSAEQVKKINALAEAHEQWAIRLGAEMRIKGMKLRSAVTEIGMEEAEKLIREQADMRAELQIARLRLQKDVQAQLTPEQAAKAAKLKNDFRARARDGRNRRAARRLSRRN